MAAPPHDGVCARAGVATGCAQRRVADLVWREARLGRSPLEVFQCLLSRGEQPTFLHSGDGDGPGGRWSLIALDCQTVFRVPADDARDPFEALREELARFSLEAMLADYFALTERVVREARERTHGAVRAS